jgi:anti-sigma B factor antagonist
LWKSDRVSGFSVTAEQDGATTLLRIAGDLDLATVGQLRSAAYAELARPGCSTLVLALGELTFLDSTGIGCWVEIRGRAVADGQRVVIRDVPDFVRRVLEISALTKLFADCPADAAGEQRTP